MSKEEDFDFLLGDESSNTGATSKTSTGWFKRKKKGILTETKDKADAPEGLWSKCPNCKHTCTISDLKENLFVCPNCNYHHRIGSEEYFTILFDQEEEYIELFAGIVSKDFPKTANCSKSLSFQELVFAGL